MKTGSWAGAAMLAATVAVAAVPAHAATVCGGGNFSTCASVAIGSVYSGGTWTITMEVTNPVGNNTVFNSIGLHSLPAGATFSAGTTPAGYRFSTGPSGGFSGEGIDSKRVKLLADAPAPHNALQPGESLVWTFTITGANQHYVFDDWAIHGISGPNGCSTKLVVTNGVANHGPHDEKCGNGHFPPPTVVPEPASVALVATGLLGILGGGALRNRKRRVS